MPRIAARRQRDYRSGERVPSLQKCVLFHCTRHCRAGLSPTAATRLRFPACTPRLRAAVFVTLTEHQPLKRRHSLLHSSRESMRALSKPSARSARERAPSERQALKLGRSLPKDDGRVN